MREGDKNGVWKVIEGGVKYVINFSGCKLCFDFSIFDSLQAYGPRRSHTLGVSLAYES